MMLKSIGKNQTELTTKKFTVFFSYNTPVAFCNIAKTGKTATHYSTTTTRHINAFFNRYGIDPKTVPKIQQETINNLIK